MDEKYISVTKFKESLAKLIVEGGTEATRTTIARTLGEVVPQLLDDEPDVQPVPQWISVKDRLPESEKEVLVCYRYTWGDGSTSYGFGISWWYSNAKRWRDGCLLKGVEVLYWMPLPEPPKDGEQNV